MLFRSLGVPAPLARESSAYRFIATQEGSDDPIAYDPCRPIHVVVDGRTQVSGGAEMVSQALFDVSRATGLQFVVDEPTDEAPVEGRVAYQPDRFPWVWAPVLISWTDPSVIPGLEGDVAGLAGSAWVTVDQGSVNVSGSVQLDGPQLAEIARFEGLDGVRAVITHELGHLVGLDHVDDPNQLMYPSNGTGTSLADGDLTGLSRLGQGRCFPNV